MKAGQNDSDKTAARPRNSIVANEQYGKYSLIPSEPLNEIHEYSVETVDSLYETSLEQKSNEQKVKPRVPKLYFQNCNWSGNEFENIDLFHINETSRDISEQYSQQKSFRLWEESETTRVTDPRTTSPTKRIQRRRGQQQLNVHGSNIPMDLN